MMIDGMLRLAAALSDRYRLERELGRGGMATAPDHGGRDTPDIAGRQFNYAQPALFGELAIMLWLLVKEAKPVPARS